MKRIINILLVFLLSLTVAACSDKAANQKTEEELREEVKAELEEEAKLKEELKAEIKEEMENENSIKPQATVLEGTVIPNNVPYGIGIALKKTIKAGENEASEIYFDDDIISNYIPRKYFIYSGEGQTAINADYAGTIPIKVEVDPSSYNYDEDLDRVSAVIEKIISIDGEDNPADKSNNDYSLDYYKQVFYTYCYEGSSFIPKDVIETYYYQNTDDPIIGDTYKTAVDKILEAGFFINMGEGDYYIENEQKTYLDGEVESADNTIEKETEILTKPKSESNGIKPGTYEELSPSEPEVAEENDYTQGYKYQVENNGLNVTYYNTGNTETIVEYQVGYDVKDAKNSNVHSPGYYIGEIKNPNHSEDKSKLFFITGNNELLAYNFEDKNLYSYMFKSEYSLVKIKDYKLITSGQYTGYYAILTTDDKNILFDSNFKKAMDIESIYADNITEAKYDGSQNIKGYSSETINGMNVDYSECIAVVVPQYSGRYKDSLSADNVFIGAIYEMPEYKPGETHAMVFGPQPVYKTTVNFAVFGTVDNITIKYINSSEDKTETKTRQNISNKLMQIGTNFPNDMTAIKVSFTATLPDGTKYNGSFTLDDMRSASEYKPIMIKFQ